MSLILAQASIIVDKALEKGRELGLKPLTVAVLDAGGHLTALKREDGSSLLGAGIAGGEGWGGLGVGVGRGGGAPAPPPPGPPAIRSSFRRSVPHPGAALSRFRVVC